MISFATELEYDLAEKQGEKTPYFSDVYYLYNGRLWGKTTVFKNISDGNVKLTFVYFSGDTTKDMGKVDNCAFYDEIFFAIRNSKLELL